jgi:hypothetical protein
MPDPVEIRRLADAATTLLADGDTSPERIAAVRHALAEAVPLLKVLANREEQAIAERASQWRRQQIMAQKNTQRKHGWA